MNKQKVNYLTHHPVKSKQKRRRKLEDKYINNIIRVAENKTTSSMSSSRIANIINNQIKEDGKNTSIPKAIFAEF